MSVEDSKSEIDEKLNAFYNFLKEFKSSHSSGIIHVAITGDFIFNYGFWRSEADRDASIDTFRVFLEAVRETLDIPKNNFIFCYGNHDKSRLLYNLMLSEKGVKTYNRILLEKEEKASKEDKKLSGQEKRAIARSRIKGADHNVIEATLANLSVTPDW